MGESVGAPVTELVLGELDGDLLGEPDGLLLGETEGDLLGDSEGLFDGFEVGTTVTGLLLGLFVGALAKKKRYG